jgi:hypothetical protein
MLAWTRNLMGDMRGSADAARQVRAMLGPGQEPGFQLGSTAWLVDALAWLGEWDEALVQASRLMDLWTESEIPAPKYALNGFTRAWWISRSRGEVGRAAEWEDATRRILQEDAREGRLHLLLAVIDGEQDLGRVVDKWSTFATSMRLDHPAWALTVIADELRGPADMAALRDIAAGEPWTGAPLLRAGVDRLTGLAEQDEEALVRALTAFEHAGTRPAAARVRAELGTLRGDRGLVDDALRVLEGIGDVRHLERVERRWGAR